MFSSALDRYGREFADTNRIVNHRHGILIDILIGLFTDCLLISPIGHKSRSRRLLAVVAVAEGV